MVISKLVSVLILSLFVLIPVGLTKVVEEAAEQENKFSFFSILSFFATALVAICFSWWEHCSLGLNNEIGTSASDSEWLLNALIVFLCAYPLQFLIYRIIIKYHESQNNHKLADDSNV